ncbi:hypothetical protein AABB24_008890 [Solanum stoloniferum]|uniref:Uncharacterized protein n=1 Tax=Solanum stoloniferum TaxID=62892 RepID=A0ABD2UH85_9SOLN
MFIQICISFLSRILSAPVFIQVLAFCVLYSCIITMAETNQLFSLPSCILVDILFKLQKTSIHKAWKDFWVLVLIYLEFSETQDENGISFLHGSLKNYTIEYVAN